jgi:hypothetical protein
MLGGVRGAGIIRSGIAAAQRLSSDAVEGVGDLARLENILADLVEFRLLGFGLRSRSYTELATDSSGSDSISASRLPVGFLFGGLGSLFSGGGPGSRLSVVNVRVRECLLLVFSRSEVDLRIVDKWFSDVDRWCDLILCGDFVGAYGSFNGVRILGRPLDTDTVILEFLEAVLFGHLDSEDISYPGAATLLNNMFVEDCLGIKDRGTLETNGHESRIPGIRKSPFWTDRHLYLVLGRL